MIKEGLIDEVSELIKRFPKQSPAFEGIGYKEVIQYLDRHLSRSEMVERIKIHSRQLAKRQLTWFNRFENVDWKTINF